MSEAKIADSVIEVVATLAGLFRHQGQLETAEILENSRANFEETNFDNWNGGTYTWALRLQIPLPQFALIEPRLSNIEKEIGLKLEYFDRLHSNDNFGEVTISPLSPGSPLASTIVPTEIEVARLWPEGHFRLFLSHVSEYKIDISKLKDELVLRGVAAFVAHEDVEPSLEWRDEIELGLRSMHALVALITPDFRQSPWTDQEVGWALGRGVLVLPVRLGADPYGFAGKFQGVSGSLDSSASLATSITEVLLRNPQTHVEMRRSIVTAFRQARSYVMAQTLRKLIVNITDFTDDEKTSMRKACTENSNVVGAHFVTDAIYKAIGNPTIDNPDEEIPF